MGLCFGSFISHTEKLLRFLRQNRGRVLVWAGANQRAAGGPVVQAGKGLFSEGYSKEGPEESWELPVPQSPSGSVWQQLCKIRWEGCQ